MANIKMMRFYLERLMYQYTEDGNAENLLNKLENKILEIKNEDEENSFVNEISTYHFPKTIKKKISTNILKNYLNDKNSNLKIGPK